MIWRALVAATLLALSGAASAQPLPFVLKQIGPGVYAAIDGPEHKAGSNAGFVIGDDGVLVVDAFFNARRGQSARRRDPPADAQADPLRRQHALSSRSHRRRPGAARRRRDHHRPPQRPRLGPDQQRQPVRRPHHAGAEGADRRRCRCPTSRPTRTSPSGSARARSWCGPCSAIPAATSRSAVPDAKVLFTGDLLWRKVAPNLIDGSVKEWAATDADFAAMPDAAQHRPTCRAMATSPT